MYISMPRDWGDIVSPRDGISVSREYSVDCIRDALRQGEKTFLIGADAISDSAGWLFVEDHLALFGAGTLVGANHPAGPRFPNLRGMYIVPEIEGESVRSGIVLRVPDIRLCTGAELGAFACDALVSHGVDQAIAAAHGGARVIFILNCRKPGSKENSDYSFLNRLLREIEGGEE